MAVGLLLLFSAVVQSQEEAARSEQIRRRAESINTMLLAMPQFPPHGADIRLEGRVVGTDSWYHTIIPAEPGDRIEVRLRIAVADASTLATQVAESTADLNNGKSTFGLKSVDTGEHKKVINPDGDLADYVSPDKEHIAYVYGGEYEFQTEDNWWYSTLYPTIAIDDEIMLNVAARYSVLHDLRLARRFVPGLLLFVFLPFLADMWALNRVTKTRRRARSAV